MTDGSNNVDSALKSPLTQGMACFESGDLEGAEQNLMLAREIENHQGEADAALGLVYWLQGRYPEAEFAFKEALTASPKNIEAWLGLGETHLAKGELYRAEDCFRAALDIDSKCGQGWNGLGMVYLTNGEFERAKMYFKHGIEGNSPEARFNLSTLLSEQNRLSEARAALEPLLEIREFEVESSLHLGYICLKEGDFEEAMDFFNRAARLKKGALRECYAEGMAHFHNGVYDRALLSFEKALSLSPNYFPAKNASSACRSRLRLRRRLGCDFANGTFKFSDKGDELMGRVYGYLEGTELEPPMVSIIINARKLDYRLERCLNRCLHLNYPSYEIIVLPDRPFNRSQRGLRIIPTGRVSEEIKRTIGAREARGEVLAFLDSDADPFRDWLSQRMNLLHRSDACLVGGAHPTRSNNGSHPSARGFLNSLSGENWFLMKHGLFHRSGANGNLWWDMVVMKPELPELAGKGSWNGAVKDLVRSCAQPHKKDLKSSLLYPALRWGGIWPLSMIAGRFLTFVTKSETGYKTLFKLSGNKEIEGRCDSELNLESGSAEAVITP